ncbi:variant erythrocyte surface antigen-1 family protein [Babesia divergens]|uniref:Variant erythrocyte surface antigen-1 family protein n=1 Tax=Babesia divergens TaxID=32595 RepID=A0AAD9LG66_BABDI|nr:variant erythrocyte surface antigen-1 family protein [Babesia divergens]
MANTSELLRCPKNLKECIDWVLRATGKDNGHNNDIVNLKNALKAELEGSYFNSNDLTQLVQGLCLFMGYPSCLCKTKESVKEGLQKIYEELKINILLISCSNSKLNCDSCKSNDVPCKCCVIQSIKDVKECPCLQTQKSQCHCAGSDVSCNKVLAGLEACLHLQCLQSDMNDICQCKADSECCKGGKCNGVSGGSCDFCKNLQTKTPVPTTGLGLSPPNPIRLAKRLEKFFGNGGQKPVCTCTCGSGSSPSCCCLACGTDQCAQACSCKGSPGKCGHQSQPSQGCPRQKFCLAINSIKIPAQSTERTCCDSGHKCHCEVDKKCQATSGQGSSGQGLKCCIETSGSNYKHSLKCMIRRVVKFFKDLSLDSSSSQPNRSRICCELVCVVKTCYFIRDFYNKNGQTFKKALETLRFAGPCGHELYRLIDGFLQGCVFPVAGFDKYDIIEKIKAAQKSCSQCSSASSKQSSPSPCTCCSSGTSSCQACKILLEDPSLKSLFHPEYVSSYDSSSAKWEDLCPTTPKPSKCCCGQSSCSCSKSSSSSLCCQSPSSCDPKNCCPDCPQRKAAKIFLGMLPCMYWGLKILYDRCKYDSGFAGWNQKRISEASGLKDFLSAWGFDVSTLSSKNASGLPPVLDILFGSSESPGTFDTLYNLVSKKYFSKTLPSSPCSSSCPSPSSSSHVYPSTVRSILLWLSGLPFSRGFSALLSHSKGLCPPSEKSLDPDEFLYYIYVSCFFLPVSVISAIQRPEGSKSFLPSTSDWTSFCYPSDSSALADMFFDYIRKIYNALKFLCIQCKNDRNSAGWRDCAFGQSCVTALQSSLKSTSSSGSSCCSDSGPYGILCTSVPGHYDVHEHCISSKPDVKCLGLTGKCEDSGNGSDPTDAHTNGKCTAAGPCPHPLLMFLIDGSDSQSKPQASSYSLFKLPKDSSVPPMGFSKENLPTPGRHGKDLYAVLKVFCDDGFYPLTRLLKFLTRVSRTPPETLGELFLFFKKLAEALDSGPLKDSFVNWINGEPGFYPATMLKTALEQLYKLNGSHSSGDHSVASLYSLNDCEGPKGSSGTPPTCGKYLYPLIQDASDIFGDDFIQTYLSWICYRAEKFKTLLEEFKQKFSDCCSSGKCQKIVECPCALPLIYSRGFQFMSPSGLGCVNSWGQEHGKHGGKGQKEEQCTRKSCQDFIDQLEKVLGLDGSDPSKVSSSPLQALLTVIDNFLWHIRLPFIYAFLYIWILVISYFYYVQFYKLDLLHIDSHLHLPRSFKILPSTLFSDTSSKLKDLSYFTL